PNTVCVASRNRSQPSQWLAASASAGSVRFSGRKSAAERSGVLRGISVPPLPFGVAMQTFLPYPSFERTARVLDVRRLGKQRVEALQVLRAQHIPNYGWRHHPVVKMWRGHDEALVYYGVTI